MPQLWKTGRPATTTPTTGNQPSNPASNKGFLICPPLVLGGDGPSNGCFPSSPPSSPSSPTSHQHPPKYDQLLNELRRAQVREKQRIMIRIKRRGMSNRIDWKPIETNGTWRPNNCRARTADREGGRVKFLIQQQQQREEGFFYIFSDCWLSRALPVAFDDPALCKWVPTLSRIAYWFTARPLSFSFSWIFMIIIFVPTFSSYY